MQIEIKFTKAGLMKYISHLDLVRLFSRALRRAEIPVAISQGFTPRPLFSIRRALKLGVESFDEVAVFKLREAVALAEFKARLQAQLPEGIEILEAKEKKCTRRY